jgi:hypothetical protein
MLLPVVNSLGKLIKSKILIQIQTNIIREFAKVPAKVAIAIDNIFSDFPRVIWHIQNYNSSTEILSYMLYSHD